MNKKTYHESDRIRRHKQRASTTVIIPRTTQILDDGKQRILPLRLQEAIRDDPRFHVYARDDKHWIEPLKGGSVPVPSSAASEPIIKSFMVTHYAHWQQHGLLSYDRIIEMRWRYDVLALLSSHKRHMSIFDKRSGYWLNPFSGVVVPEVMRDGGKITANTVKAMAASLALSQPDNRADFFSNTELKALMTDLGYAQSGLAGAGTNRVKVTNTSTRSRRPHHSTDEL